MDGQVWMPMGSRGLGWGMSSKRRRRRRQRRARRTWLRTDQASAPPCGTEEMMQPCPLYLHLISLVWTGGWISRPSFVLLALDGSKLSGVEVWGPSLSVSLY